MLDSSTARWPGPAGGSLPFGAVLDSSCDRLADAAVFGALAWYFAVDGQRWLLLAALLCLVLGSLTSYIRARAEAAGLTATVGIAERAERLIIVLVGTGLTGLPGLHVPVRAGGRAVDPGRRLDDHGRAASRDGVPAVAGAPAGRCMTVLLTRDPREPMPPSGSGTRRAGDWSKPCRERVSARAFRSAADAATVRNGRGTQQLRKNLRRVVGPGMSELRMDALVGDALRSYSRYWLETFRFHGMDARGRRRRSTATAAAASTSTPRSSAARA